MIRIHKEEADRLVLSVLTELSKVEDKDFAKQSLDLMDDSLDNALFTGVILNKSIPSLFSKEEEDLRNSLVTIIGSFFYSVKEDGTDISGHELSKNLIKFMSKEDVSRKGYKESIRMKFALSQFAIAFLEYEKLEKKYPAVMKFM
jgi:hypothetical protein